VTSHLATTWLVKSIAAVDARWSIGHGLTTT
jgi:hypothetical protein